SLVFPPKNRWFRPTPEICFRGFIGTDRIDRVSINPHNLVPLDYICKFNIFFFFLQVVFSIFFQKTLQNLLSALQLVYFATFFTLLLNKIYENYFHNKSHNKAIFFIILFIN
ncbi:MAG TPA: hypothetical protein DEQ68_07520, partial [Ruminococcaceae bacterium]|nr:hypothetical protein [Oscillospiraceae bacterium]